MQSRHLFIAAILLALACPAWAVKATAVDTIALASPHAAAVVASSNASAWGGERTGAEATLSDRVADYAISATLDPARHTVDGRERLVWRNRSAIAVRSVYLHLYLNAFESANSTYFTEKRHGGTASPDADTRDDAGSGQWGHIELRGVRQNGAAVPWAFVHPDNGPALDHTVVRFDLPAAVAPGAATTLDIVFFDQLPRVINRSGYVGSFHLVGQWFPKIAVLELPGERGATAPRWNAHEYHLNSEFFADFGYYDVLLMAPNDYVIGATGERQGAPVEHKGWLTHHFIQGDVHDFAWTADHRSATLTGTYRGQGGPDVAITVLYPPEFKADAAPVLKAAQDALAYFSRTLGPYPYRTLTAVVPPYNADAAGGMEYPTFFTTESYAGLKPHTLSSYLLDFVTIHEFGHGYFYGILASNEFEEPMLDEGLNEFWDLRMMHGRGQRIDLTMPLLDWLGFHPTGDVFEAERGDAPLEEPADPLGQNSYDRLQGINPVYSRSAITLRDLEAALGKEATERAFRLYYRRWKFRHPSVADLRDALAEGSGRPDIVNAVFAQQVYATARIDDRVAAIDSEEELPQTGTALVAGKWVERSGAQVERNVAALREQWRKAHPGADGDGDKGPFPFRTSVLLRRRGAPVPQTLVVHFADGSVERVVWDNGERWQRFTWLKPARAVSAELDPQQVHLLDAAQLDNSRTVKANGDASLRWTGDFAALVQLFLSLLATL